MGYLSLTMSLFRPVIMPYVFQEIIFSKAMPLTLVFSYTCGYLGLNMRREG